MDDRKGEGWDCEAELLLVRVYSVFEQNLDGVNRVSLNSVVKSWAAVKSEVYCERSLVVFALLQIPLEYRMIAVVLYGLTERLNT
jgi:hypothetical protein